MAIFTSATTKTGRERLKRYSYDGWKSRKFGLSGRKHILYQCSIRDVLFPNVYFVNIFYLFSGSGCYDFPVIIFPAGFYGFFIIAETPGF